MNQISPRWAKLSYVAVIFASGIWVGSFTTETSHSATSWISLVLSLVLLPIGAHMLLRKDTAA